MTHEEKPETFCVLRLFGVPLWAVQQAAQEWGTAVQCKSRGAEILAAVQAETPAALEKAKKAFAGRFAAALYGEGDTTLARAVVQALEAHHRLLICCDADAGALLEPRLETVPGAEKVFDFGAMSYADAKTREKLTAKTCGVRGGPIPAKLARAGAAQRLVGVDYAAGCVERAEDTVLFLGSRKGCWIRTVANSDTPALWLLDMTRRAALGLPQAEGTAWQNYGRPVPQEVLAVQALPAAPTSAPAAVPQPRRKHRLRRLLLVLLALLVLGAAAAWYCTGGDLTALPGMLPAPLQELLHADSQPHAGAELI